MLLLVLFGILIFTSAFFSRQYIVLYYENQQLRAQVQEYRRQANLLNDSNKNYFNQLIHQMSLNNAQQDKIYDLGGELRKALDSNVTLRRMLWESEEELEDLREVNQAHTNTIDWYRNETSLLNNDLFDAWDDRDKWQQIAYSKSKSVKRWRLYHRKLRGRLKKLNKAYEKLAIDTIVAAEVPMVPEEVIAKGPAHEAVVAKSLSAFVKALTSPPTAEATPAPKKRVAKKAKKS